MKVEHVDAPTAVEPSLSPVGRSVEPPTWLTAGLVVAYVAALAALAFLPGATLIERLRALDGGICAQLPTHSFFPAGEQLPLCSRNTGIYTGFACTFLVLLATGRLRATRFPGRWAAIVLGVAFLFMAEDGFNSLFLDLHLPHLYQPHNLVRLISGLGAGTAMAAFVFPVANTLIWRDEDERSSFQTPGQLAVMLPVLLLAFLAIGSQAGVSLYPVAILSSAGLLMAVTLVNVIILLGIGNRVGHFATLRQFFPVFTLAVVIAIIELMALFALKENLLHALTAAP